VRQQPDICCRKWRSLPGGLAKPLRWPPSKTTNPSRQESSVIRLTSLLLLTLAFWGPVQAQESSVDSGSAIFQSECAHCHVQADIEMRITNDWLGRPASELYEAIKATMPAETPGSLSDQQYVDVTAYTMRMAGGGPPAG